MTVSARRKNCKIGQGLQATEPEYHDYSYFSFGLHVKSGNDRHRKAQDEEIEDDTCTRLGQVELNRINHLMAMASPRSTYRIVLKKNQLLASVVALCKIVLWAHKGIDYSPDGDCSYSDVCRHHKSGYRENSFVQAKG